MIHCPWSWFETVHDDSCKYPGTQTLGRESPGLSGEEEAGGPWARPPSHRDSAAIILDLGSRASRPLQLPLGGPDGGLAVYHLGALPVCKISRRWTCPGSGGPRDDHLQLLALLCFPQLSTQVRQHQHLGPVQNHSRAEEMLLLTQSREHTDSS